MASAPSLAPASVAGSAPPLQASVLADQINQLQGNVAPVAWANLAVTALAAWTLHEHVSPPLMWAWLLAQLVNSVFNLWAGRHVALRPATARNAKFRARACAINAFVSGLLWGVGVLLLWPAGRLDLQVMVALLVVGLAGAALHALNAYLPAYHLYMLPTLGGVFLAGLSQGGSVDLFMSLGALLYGVTCWRLAAAMNRGMVESISRRYEVAALAADLREQKLAAEEASLSKSRFLAAASHDLRQPVHALSLFVGALGQQPLGAEAARLLGHVRTSVDTLGAMFNALLDISKLDASMVRPEVAQFDLKVMLERICHDEGTLAAAKGLSVRVNAMHLQVATDPALQERVMRNLVANAVRYTETGGVLVSARRHGQVIVVRVVDTGIGIPMEKQAEVFREFVQLGNQERDRNQGLGLGLAIVRRLCSLLKLDLALRSRPGRGSCFTLRIPHVDVVPQTRTASDDAAPVPMNSLVIGQGELVLVIDDDVEILDGMHALLTGWGCHVVAATGLPDLMPRLASLPQVPKVIISDYRLRGAETGLAVVEHLRSEYNDDIPAILVTGDTAPDRLQEAEESGLTLLHKPVTPHALRHALAAAYWPRATRRSVERTALST
ncbi:MAG: hybrid sensor histidine kinase/response regulator [Rhodoferax sp.]